MLEKKLYGYQRENVEGCVDKSGVWDEHTSPAVYKVDERRGPTV